jgi:uncharacterized cupin superfamily protein
MKMYRIEDYVNLENPTPGDSHRPEILTAEHNAINLGGMFGLLVPGSQVPYHYHQNRESVIIFISGEGLEIIEGEEYAIKAGDVLFIPVKEKHMTINSSDKDLRYLEFFTCPPVTADFCEVTE